MRKQIIKNTVTAWVGMVVRLILALQLVPVLLSALGKEGYGLIGLIATIIALTSAIDMGLRQALGRELSEKVARGDILGFKSLSITSLILYLGLAAGAVTLLLTLSPWLFAVFNVTDKYYEQGIWIIRSYGIIALISSFITPVVTAGLQSFMRFDALNWVNTGTNAAASILLLFLIPWKPELAFLYWTVVMSSSKLLDFFFQFILYKKYCYNGILSLKEIKWKQLKSLSRLGSSMYVLQLTNTLPQQANPLIISYFFGISGVTLYETGSKISSMVKPLILTLSSQVHPLTTRYHVHNERSEEHKILILGTLYTLIPGVVATVGLILFAEPFCRLWIGRALGDDYKTVVFLMQLWAIADLSDYLAAMHWPMLLGKKSLKLAITVMTTSAIFTVPVAIYLVGFTHLGIIGVLMATIISGFLRRPIIVWHVCRLTGLSIWEYTRKSYIPAAFLLCILSGFHLFVQTTQISSWFAFSSYVILFLIYSFVVICIMERKMLIDLISAFRNRSSG